MPVGYIEAALAHGFRHHVIFLRILLPNVVMNTLPLIGNQLIICLKDTAFLSIITVREITAAANSVQSTYFIPLRKVRTSPDMRSCLSSGAMEQGSS